MLTATAMSKGKKVTGPLYRMPNNGSSGASISRLSGFDGIATSVAVCKSKRTIGPGRNMSSSACKSMKLRMMTRSTRHRGDGGRPFGKSSERRNSPAL